jgi:hypothetical protein
MTLAVTFGVARKSLEEPLNDLIDPDISAAFRVIFGSTKITSYKPT